MSDPSGRSARRRTTLDLVAAVARLGPGGAALYSQLYASFRLDVAEMIGNVASAAGAGRVDEAQRLLHTLAGVAGTMGATQLADAARDARAAVAAGMGEAGRSALAFLRSCFDEACTQIEASLRTLDGIQRAPGPEP